MSTNTISGYKDEFENDKSQGKGTTFRSDIKFARSVICGPPVVAHVKSPQWDAYVIIATSIGKRSITFRPSESNVCNCTTQSYKQVDRLY